MLKKYQGTLEDLHKAHVLEPNNASTLKSREDVKYMLYDYQGALEDLHKADVFLIVLGYLHAPFQHFLAKLVRFFLYDTSCQHYWHIVNDYKKVVIYGLFWFFFFKFQTKTTINPWFILVKIK